MKIKLLMPYHVQMRRQVGSHAGGSHGKLEKRMTRCDQAKLWGRCSGQSEEQIQSLISRRVAMLPNSYLLGGFI